MMQDNEVIDNPYEYYEKVVEINLLVLVLRELEL